MLSGIAFAGLLAFFAFFGFEDLAIVAEEAKAPHPGVPRAMALKLAITSVHYILVAAISVSTVPPTQLATSPAPLSLSDSSTGGPAGQPRRPFRDR